MRRTISTASLVLAAALSAACTCRPRERAAIAAAAGKPPAESPAVKAARRAEETALMDKARARTAYLPMRPEAEVRKSMPSMEGFPVVPNLIRIAAAMPKTMDAEMEAWDALKGEGTIERRMLNDVFWVVSHGNACGHCMGHMAFSAALRKMPVERLLDLEAEDGLDARRRATFAFARKVNLEPARVTKADVASLHPYYTDAQVVELILAVCRFRTMNTLAEAFGSPLETINVFDPKNRAKPPARERKGGVDAMPRS